MRDLSVSVTLSPDWFIQAGANKAEASRGMKANANALAFSTESGGKGFTSLRRKPAFPLAVFWVLNVLLLVGRETTNDTQLD
jgi:hypothetical protein